MRAGAFFFWEVVRAWASFTSFHLFIDWSGTCWLLAWCWCCCFGVLFFVCFGLSVPGLSFWSSCLTMTTLAQLHDCHSCNDERSIVQKKNKFFGLNVLIILFVSIQFCPIADHVMLTVGRSARDLLGTLAAWSKKKRCCGRSVWFVWFMLFWFW